MTMWPSARSPDRRLTRDPISRPPEPSDVPFEPRAPSVEGLTPHRRAWRLVLARRYERRSHTPASAFLYNFSQATVPKLASNRQALKAHDEAVASLRRSWE